MVDRQHPFCQPVAVETASCPPSPRTDPGVRNYRTGLLQTHSLAHHLLLLPPVRLALLIGPACPAVFPVAATCVCQPLPHVPGSPGSEYYGLIRLPRFVGLPTCSFGSGLPVQASPPARNRVGLPSSQRFSTHMPRSLETPADPRYTHHNVRSVLASAAVNASPSAFSTLTRLYQDCGVCVTPAAYGLLCVRFNTVVRSLRTAFVSLRQARRGAARSPPDAEVFPTAVTPQTGLSSSVSAATLDRGGWLALAPQGLAPCQKRQASWRTTARLHLRR